MSGLQSKKCVLKANSNTILSVEKIKFHFYCQTLGIVLDKVPQSIFNDRNRDRHKKVNVSIVSGKTIMDFLKIKDLQSCDAPLQNFVGSD